MYEVVVVNKKERKEERMIVEASSHGEACERVEKALEFSGKQISNYYVKTTRKIDEDTRTYNV